MRFPRCTPLPGSVP
jgi:ribosome-associated protein